MGITTPFPEPDSPELKRFAVQSQDEIVAQLRVMQERGAPLNAFLDAGAQFGVVTLLRVDKNVGALLFAGPEDEGLRGQLLAAPVVTFVGFVDEGKVQFSAVSARRAGSTAGPGFSVPMPAQMFWLQRRSAARLRPEAARSAVCRIPLPGGTGEWEALRILDIGTGGIAVLTYPEHFDPVVGVEIDDCRLDLPGVGGAVVSLCVRHVGPHSGDEKARCCGCEFVRMPLPVQSMLRRYVGNLVGQAMNSAPERPPSLKQGQA